MVVEGFSAECGHGDGSLFAPVHPGAFEALAEQLFGGGFDQTHISHYLFSTLETKVLLAVDGG